MDPSKPVLGDPNEDIVNVLLTDCYQIMMIYAHWKNGRHNIRAVFDLYFRKSPFEMDVTQNNNSSL